MYLPPPPPLVPPRVLVAWEIYCSQSDLSADVSSAWNFGARFSDVISRGNQFSQARLCAKNEVPEEEAV